MPKQTDIRAYAGDPFAALTINGQPFPERVRVGGHQFRVVFTPQPGASGGEKVSDDLDECNWGYINFWSQTIEINPRTSPEKWFAILLHEVLHGIDTDRKIGLSEKATGQLANGLAAFLVESGWVRVERVDSKVDNKEKR